MEIIDDEEFEEDEQFYIKLGNIRVENSMGDIESIPDLNVSNLAMQNELMKRITQQTSGLQPALRVATVPLAEEPAKLLRASVQLKQSSATATVRILDDDHGGIIQFEKGSAEVPETIGETIFRVMRTVGIYLQFLSQNSNFPYS